MKMLIHIGTVLQDDRTGWALPVQPLAVEDVDRNTRMGNDGLESVLERAWQLALPEAWHREHL